MPDGSREPTRRELRRQKRALKQAGSQRRRRLFKEALRDDPEGADPPEPDFGRCRTEALNGIDRDATRRRGRPEPSGIAG